MFRIHYWHGGTEEERGNHRTFRIEALTPCGAAIEPESEGAWAGFERNHPSVTAAELYLDGLHPGWNKQYLTRAP